MTINEEPLFLKNKEWYYFDAKEMKYKLTNKATAEAKKSYKEFYKLINSVYEKENENEKN